jgi:hypothetical protein
MSEIIAPPVLSLEGRAQMIADETGRSEHAGNPAGRRAHVAKHALAHMRAAILQSRTVEAE